MRNLSPFPGSAINSSIVANSLIPLFPCRPRTCCDPDSDAELEHDAPGLSQLPAVVGIGQAIVDAGEAVPRDSRRTVDQGPQHRRTDGVVEKVQQAWLIGRDQAGEFVHNRRRGEGEIGVGLAGLRAEGAFSPVAPGCGGVGEDEAGGEIGKVDEPAVVGDLLATRWFHAEQGEQRPLPGPGDEMIDRPVNGLRQDGLRSQVVTRPPPRTMESPAPAPAESR